MNGNYPSAEVQEKLDCRREKHNAFVNAYAQIPHDSTQIRSDIAGRAMDEFRAYNEFLNDVVEGEITDLSGFEDRLANAHGEEFAHIAEETKERASKLKKFRRNAYKAIGIRIDPVLADDIDLDIEEAASLPEVRKQQQLVEAKIRNEPLYENIRAHFINFVGALTPMEDAIIKSLALYADTGIEIGRGTVAAIGEYDFGWSAPPSLSTEYSYSRAHIMWVLERGCNDLIKIKKVRKSKHHTSGGVTTQNLLKTDFE